ncbi:MAG: cytochrome c biogenesis protein CcdA [Candidatus Gracilibacteria bacterium]|nr:cytochrome c biogenesis protein CcdA [Candidatus Gracilibacteria bacterium]
MILLIISFIAGVLTILAPCVLPLLPIILAGSIDDNSKKGPYIIIASLAISMILFSILLKATTFFITLPQSFWSMFSGGLIIGLGIITLFPDLWKNITYKLGIENKTNEVFSKSTQSKGYKKSILMGFSLGPVFTSCSPTYALILAIILPAGFLFGLLNLVMYALGLSTMLLLIALFGQSIVSKMKIVANPKGYFKKILAIIFIIVGIAIFTGYDKKIESFLIGNGYFIDLSNFEESLIDSTGVKK